MPGPARTRRLLSPLVLNYGIAVLSVTVAVAADLAFNRLSGGVPADALLLCAIVLTAWIGGTGPALLATALAILAIDYFFLQPELLTRPSTQGRSAACCCSPPRHCSSCR